MKQAMINGRQLAFFMAFLLPVSKLLELPSRLASASGGDLLIPALLGSILEGLALFGVYQFVKKRGKGVFAYLVEQSKPLATALQLFYAVLLLVYALVFLLDLEKFSLVAFSDTEPTFFSFLPFFIFSAFASCKGAKAVGRSADLCPVLFFLPFLGLVVLSVGATDFSAVFPLFEFPSL